jgi:hypothetical protein
MAALSVGRWWGLGCGTWFMMGDCSIRVKQQHLAFAYFLLSLPTWTQRLLCRCVLWNCSLPPRFVPSFNWPSCVSIKELNSDLVAFFAAHFHCACCSAAVDQARFSATILFYHTSVQAKDASEDMPVRMLDTKAGVWSTLQVGKTVPIVPRGGHTVGAAQRAS